MADQRSPVARRRELGALLRQLRVEREITLEAVADYLMCSPTKISRLETGARGVSQRDIRDLCDFYGIKDPGRRQRLHDLASEGKKSTWYSAADLPYGKYIGLEQVAVRIRQHSSDVIAGLVQTRDYATMVVGQMTPDDSAEAQRDRIEARMRRQAILSDGRQLDYHVVLDESVLRREVGGPAAMRAQLELLVAHACLPNVTVQVTSFGVGAYPSLGSSYTILNFAEPALASVVYVEGKLVNDTYLDRAAEVDDYKRAFEQASALALSPDDSVDLIKDVARTFRR